MINKFSISTFIFLGFCLNILLLIFLPDANNVVNLALRLSAVIGVTWFIYFYFKFLGLEILKDAWSGPIMFYPEIHLFDTSTGGAIITATEDEFAKSCSNLVDDRVKIIGGCCGVTENHLRSLINKLR